MSNTCAYCSEVYSKKDGEHTFPFGLGGEDIFMDCVCEECNNYFSRLELELYQKSIIGLMRSTEGIEGYKPNKVNRSPFKAPILLSFDEKNRLVLEMGQQFRMQVYVRPQIYWKDTAHYVEADSLATRDQFQKAFKHWKKNSLLLTSKDINGLACTKYEISGDAYQYIDVTSQKRINGAIQYCTLPTDHNLFQHLHPRLFMDDDGNLKIRAQTIEAARTFLHDFLNRTLANNLLSSFKEIDLSSPVIHVGFSFDQLKFQQGLVKIGLNCLLHYFPQVKQAPSIRPHLDYVRYGMGGIKGGMESRDKIIDTVPSHHNIFFISTEGHLRIRISLFNGQFAFGFWIENLPVLGRNDYCRLLINYEKRKHTFQNAAAFFGSFSATAKDLQK